MKRMVVISALLSFFAAYPAVAAQKGVVSCGCNVGSIKPSNEIGTMLGENGDEVVYQMSLTYSVNAADGDMICPNHCEIGSYCQVTQTRVLVVGGERVESTSNLAYDCNTGLPVDPDDPVIGILTN